LTIIIIINYYYLFVEVTGMGWRLAVVS